MESGDSNGASHSKHGDSTENEPVLEQQEGEKECVLDENREEQPLHNGEELDKTLQESVGKKMNSIKKVRGEEPPAPTCSEIEGSAQITDILSTSVEYNESTNDLSNREERNTEEEVISEGDFALVLLRTQKKQYKAVCRIIKFYNDNEASVLLLSPINRLKNVFVNADSYNKKIDINQVISKLPQPLVFGRSNKHRYQFPLSIDL